MDRTTKISKHMLDRQFWVFCMKYQENLKFGKNLLGKPAQNFMNKTTQANFGFVWLNRNFLWCQDGTFDDANHF